MDHFKVPLSIPQDLLLIQELVGLPSPASSVPAQHTPATVSPSANVGPSQDDHISSSDDDAHEDDDDDLASEEEIAADLITGADPDDDEVLKSPSVPPSENMKNATRSTSSSSSSSSSSDDSDSDSDSDSEPSPNKPHLASADLDLDDDDEETGGASGPSSTSKNYFATKHEIIPTDPDGDVHVPEILEASPEEVLEPVGEVLNVNVPGKVVIVRGLPSDLPPSSGMGMGMEVEERPSEKALDSDTLLFFGDRKVLGYISETFGPTTQPFYIVKFTSPSGAFPLPSQEDITPSAPTSEQAQTPSQQSVPTSDNTTDPSTEEVQGATTIPTPTVASTSTTTTRGIPVEGKQVYHIPARSRFIWVNQIKLLSGKGSDASNVHDEEPADDELEFSDDEKEAEWRSRLKRKRAESRSSRAPSLGPGSSSRHSTPMSDITLQNDPVAQVLGRNAYDEHGPYDIDYSAVPSSSSSSPTLRGAYDGAGGGGGRPPPIPYDDPYGDEYTAPDVVDRESRYAASASASLSGAFSAGSGGGGYGRSGGRERGGGDRSETNGRGGHGHGYGKGREERGGGGRGRGGRGRERERERDRGGRGRGDGGTTSKSGGQGPSYSQNHQQQQQHQEYVPSYNSFGGGRDGQYGQMQSQGRMQMLMEQQQQQQYGQGYGYGYGGYAPAGAGGYGGYGYGAAGYNGNPTGMQQYGYHPSQQQGHGFQQQPHRGYGANASYALGAVGPGMGMQSSSRIGPGGVGDGQGVTGGGGGGGGGEEGMRISGLVPRSATPFVQPHINPRFASAFGMGMGMSMNMGALRPASGVHAGAASFGIGAPTVSQVQGYSPVVNAMPAAVAPLSGGGSGSGSGSGVGEDNSESSTKV